MVSQRIHNHTCRCNTIKEKAFQRQSYQIWNKEANETLIEGIEYGNPESRGLVFLNKHTQLNTQEYINKSLKVHFKLTQIFKVS